MDFKVVVTEEDLDRIRVEHDDPADFTAAVRMDDEVLALFYSKDGAAFANLFVYFARNGAVDLAMELNELLSKNAALRVGIRDHIENGHDQDGKLENLLKSTALEI